MAFSLGHVVLKTCNFILNPRHYNWSSLEWRGLQFANPLGTSGGIDKNAELTRAWWSFGAGFVEVGTITPRAQEANPGQIVDRDNIKMALWNKMGFPNAGVATAKKHLDSLPRPHFTPVFVNIGKNRDTKNEQALDDYLYCIRELRGVADAFVVNISSPNTTGLRDLLKPESLRKFLLPLVEECAGQIPLLLKLSPDMEDADFLSALEISCDLGVDGWILTNTTLARESGMKFSSEGGVSGRPLSARSKALLQKAVSHLGPRRQGKLLVSVGGVMTADEVFERLRLGADLVQVYSALVFSGPTFFEKVANKFEYERSH